MLEYREKVKPGCRTVKVLHVIPSISPVRGGPTQVVLNLVKALREKGEEAEITTTNDDGADVLDVPLGRCVEYEGVPVWFFPRFTSRFKKLSLGGDRAFIFSASWTRWLSQNLANYDVLDNHYLFSYGPTCAGFLARCQNIPYTVRTMGQLSPWALAQSRRKKQLYSYLIERPNLNGAAAVHCTSIGEAEDVGNFGVTSPKAVIPLGVEAGEVIPNAQEKLRQLYYIPPNIPIILFLSRLHCKKRPELLLETLATLKLKYPFHLIMAGGAENVEYGQSLRRLTASLGLEDCTTYTGLVKGDIKELVLQGSDLFVLPSFAENFAIAVAEAMVSGLPVIVTPQVQISPDITAARAGLVVEGEIESLGGAIASLLNSPSLRRELGENGQRFARLRYSWSTIASQLIELHEAILDRQTIPSSLTL